MRADPLCARAAGAKRDDGRRNGMTARSPRMPAGAAGRARTRSIDGAIVAARGRKIKGASRAGRETPRPGARGLMRRTNARCDMRQPDRATVAAAILSVLVAAWTAPGPGGVASAADKPAAPATLLLVTEGN